jgi:hypothetical protein
MSRRWTGRKPYSETLFLLLIFGFVNRRLNCWGSLLESEMLSRYPAMSKKPETTKSEPM